MADLEAILRLAQERRRLIVNRQTKPVYEAFLERQIPNYPNLFSDEKLKGNVKNKFINLLVDKLLVFGYLMRFEEVQLKEFEPEHTYLSDFSILKLIRSRGLRKTDYPDYRVADLVIRRYAAHQRDKLLIPIYQNMIDDVGNDPEVKKLWGTQLRYDKHFCTNYYKPKKRKPKAKNT